MAKTIVEVCCGSADDVIESKKAGADRVELNSNLFQGGLTPSIGELIVAKEATGMPIMTMVRPREGGFCYTENEFKTAMKDAELLLKHASDGLVFGFLHADGTIDVERCREILSIIGEKESVFHRAIDVVPDWKEAIDILCGLGVTRILTSGQASSVPEGADTIAEMVRYAAGRIQILPGAGIKLSNVRSLIEKIGCTQVHIAPQKICSDPSATGNPEIFYGGALYPPENIFHMADKDLIQDFRQKVN